MSGFDELVFIKVYIKADCFTEFQDNLSRYCPSFSTLTYLTKFYAEIKAGGYSDQAMPIIVEQESGQSNNER